MSDIIDGKYVFHHCHFCGDDVDQTGYDRVSVYDHYKEKRITVPRRHYLSDCRPDLVDGSYDGTVYEDGPL